jgi:hypothetical protein
MKGNRYEFYSSLAAQKRILIEDTSKPLLPRRLRLEPISVELLKEVYYQSASQAFCGFKRRELRKMLSRLDDHEDYRSDRSWVISTWTKLRLVVTSYHELEHYCSELFKHCLLPDEQAHYQEAMDRLTGDNGEPFLRQIEKFSAFRLRVSGMGHDSGFGKPALNYPIKEVNTVPNDRVKYYMSLIQDVDPELWVPLSAFPLWDEEGESKMPLSMLPKPQLEEGCKIVRERVRSFLDRYAPKSIFIPSALSLTKVGNQRYNDEGTVRPDCEKPQSSHSSGFLYQRFVTKHGVTREPWLPGKATKNNNSWWFFVVDQVLKDVPYSALLKEPEEIYEQVAPRIGKNHIYFDVSGFGIQFIREYLQVAIEEIVKTYNEDVTMSEQADIARRILAEVDIMFDDGTHLQPPRGIGLGYYENLKSLVMMALLDHESQSPHEKPISVFGDQAILPMTPATMYSVNKLRNLGFCFTKTSKMQLLGDHFKWVGQRFGKDRLIEPRRVWSHIFGAWNKEFHWERKSALEGIKLPESAKHVWKRVALQYEQSFGFEFERGESFRHPQQGGVYPYAELETGWSKFANVAPLQKPHIHYGSSILHSVPFGHSPKRGEAHDFQRKRERAFKKPAFDVDLYHYVEPIIVPNKSRKPQMSKLARAMPLWADVRTLVYDGYTTGKVVSGLQGEELMVAPYRQKYARDPFESRATGGYSIVTQHRCDFGASLENMLIADIASESRVICENYITKREVLSVSVQEHLDEGLRALPARNQTQNPYQNEDILDFLRRTLLEGSGHGDATEDEESDLPLETAEQLNLLLRDETLPVFVDEDGDPPMADNFLADMLGEFVPDINEDMFISEDDIPEDDDVLLSTIGVTYEAEPEPVRVLGWII